MLKGALLWPMASVSSARRMKQLGSAATCVQEQGLS
jgi:hypothetical protein